MNYPSDLNKPKIKYPKETPANREWMNREQHEGYINRLDELATESYIDVGRFRISERIHLHGVIYMIYEYLDFWYGCPERFYVIDKDTYELIIENQSDKEKVYEIIKNA
jgi:hypothetical protein